MRKENRNVENWLNGGRVQVPTKQEVSVSEPCAAVPDRENQYRPWESEGISEVAYWKKRYLEMSKENSEMAALLALVREAMLVYNRTGQSAIKEIDAALGGAHPRTTPRTAPQPAEGDSPPASPSEAG